MSEWKTLRTTEPSKEGSFCQECRRNESIVALGKPIWLGIIQNKSTGETKELCLDCILEYKEDYAE